VELHGGQIGCSSVPGHGSEFFFVVDCDAAAPQGTPPGFAKGTMFPMTPHAGAQRLEPAARLDGTSLAPLPLSTMMPARPVVDQLLIPMQSSSAPSSAATVLHSPVGIIARRVSVTADSATAGLHSESRRRMALNNVRRALSETESLFAMESRRVSAAEVSKLVIDQDESRGSISSAVSVQPAHSQLHVPSVRDSVENANRGSVSLTASNRGSGSSHQSDGKVHRSSGDSVLHKGSGQASRAGSGVFYSYSPSVSVARLTRLSKPAGTVDISDAIEDHDAVESHMRAAYRLTLERGALLQLAGQEARASLESTEDGGSRSTLNDSKHNDSIIDVVSQVAEHRVPTRPAAPRLQASMVESGTPSVNRVIKVTNRADHTRLAMQTFEALPSSPASTVAECDMPPMYASASNMPTGGSTPHGRMVLQPLECKPVAPPLVAALISPVHPAQGPASSGTHNRDQTALSLMAATTATPDTVGSANHSLLVPMADNRTVSTGSVTSSTISSAPISPINGAAVAPFPGLRVLLAEDHAPTAKLMKMVLIKMGCAVTLVENGALAVKAFASPSSAGAAGSGAGSPLDAFDLVLMDGNMPELGK